MHELAELELVRILAEEAGFLHLSKAAQDVMERSWQDFRIEGLAIAQEEDGRIASRRHHCKDDLSSSVR